MGNIIIQSNADEEEDPQKRTESRGKGLVATDFIPKGSIIFTEKAAIATQVPPNMSNSSSSGESLDTKASEKMIQACQSCFRSLEPLSTLSSSLPCPELWPVLPFLQWNDSADHDTIAMGVMATGMRITASTVTVRQK